MNKYPHIAARVFNKPLLMDGSYAEVFCAALKTRFDISAIESSGAIKPVANVGLDRQAVQKFYTVTNGVAQIPVNGTLVHKSGYVGSQSGMMGYDGFNQILDVANTDPSVRAILLDIDSPGGEVAGVETAVAKIKASLKPVYAHANEMAASAAYWMASSAKKVYLSNTASVGSIGVITVHTDYSKQLNDDGIKVTIIKAGQHKADGNPYEALPSEVQARVQAEVDSLRTEFAASVATGRGMTVDAVLATEALMYRGQDAVAAGLADGVKSYDDTLKMIIQAVAIGAPVTRPQGQQRPQGQRSPQGQKGNAMTDDSNHAQATGQGEQVDLTAVLNEARQTAAASERTRIAAILAHGASDTAKHLAFNTDMTPDAAAQILKTIPQAGAVVGQSEARVKALADMQAVETVEPVQAEKQASGMDAKVANAIKTLKGAK